MPGKVGAVCEFRYDFGRTQQQHSANSIWCLVINAHLKMNHLNLMLNVFRPRSPSPTIIEGNICCFFQENHIDNDSWRSLTRWTASKRVAGYCANITNYWQNFQLIEHKFHLRCDAAKVVIVRYVLSSGGSELPVHQPNSRMQCNLMNFIKYFIGILIIQIMRNININSMFSFWLNTLRAEWHFVVNGGGEGATSL